MSLVSSYNPWAEAAAYGEGIGNALSQALIQRPQLDARARLLQNQTQQEQARFPLEQQLLSAQVSAAQRAPQLQQQQMAMEMQKLQQYGEAMQAQAAERNAMTDWYRQRIADAQSPQTQVKPQTQANEFTQQSQIASLIPKLLAGSAAQQGIDKTLSIVVSPELRSAAMSQAGQPNALDMVQRLVSQAQLVPETSTNVTPHPLLKMLTLGMGGAPTQQVTTNSMLATLPQGLGLPQTQAQPQQSNRIRVKSPNGQVGTVSQEALQEALQQGYQVVQ